MDIELAKSKLQILIDKYDLEKFSGKIKGYTEQDTKNAFISPIFEILGWNMSDRHEVSSEEQISGDRADYGFYINERIKFYVEAKKLSADLDKEEFAHQAIKYSWNKGVTWAVLTDFENIKVFCAQEIDKHLIDKLLFDIPYNELVERFDQLKLLSKESIEKNEIDTYAERIGKKLQKKSVSSLLYEDLNKSREILTKELSAWNPKVEKDLLDEGVQKLLDRLIFLRVAEDRGVEENILKTLLRETDNRKTGQTIFESMVKKFRELDKIYDSGLFSPHPFEKWSAFGSGLREVIEILYGKKGYYEYDFKVMPADILGSVYENYLGYKLSTVKRKKEEKIIISKDAKKRKEQGIYYTPTYIVDYIVRNALKPVLDKCTSISELKKIKVLDPACGSGSFLIKALEVINEKYKEFGHLGDQFTKFQILLDNIYGVDLDSQAVEIARLNLLINALDKREKMPGLDKNIKNGNSLISGTDKDLQKYFGEDYRNKKPFNWQEQFPEVFKQGGFDVIIGNPPYVNLANINDGSERKYLKENFETAKNKSDLYSFFTEKAVRLLKEKGDLGFIFSNSWLGTDSFSKFRQFLIENTTIIELIKLPPDVFESATVTTIIILLKKEKTNNKHQILLKEYNDGNFKNLDKLSYERIINSPAFNLSFQNEIKISVPTVKLGDVADFSLGIKTSDDNKFISDKKIDNNSYKLLRGKDVSRYSYTYKGMWIWYKPDLMMKKTGAGPRKLEYFTKEKIFIKDIANNIQATIDSNGFLSNDTLSLIYNSEIYNLYFILAILNSGFMNYWFKSTFPAGLHIKTNQLKQIPIPKLDLKNEHSKNKHDKLVQLANIILDLHKNIFKLAENSDDWKKVKSEIEITDKKIDQEVFRLYELKDEEIKVVEKNIK